MVKQQKAGGSSLFRTFRKFDTNKDGVIDFEEFKDKCTSGT